MMMRFLVALILSCSVSVRADDSILRGEAPDENSSDSLDLSIYLGTESFSRPISDARAMKTQLGVQAAVDGFDARLMAPFISGTKQGRTVNEVGNPDLSLNFRVLSPSPLSVWIETEAVFSRPGALLAYRHDSYRGGAEIRFTRNRWSSRMGAGYWVRTNEEDRLVDVGDLVDGHFSMGFVLAPRWSAGVRWDILASQGVQRDGLPIARSVQWTGATPSLACKLTAHSTLSAGLTFPLTMDRSPEETEVSLWDHGQGVSEVSWKTQLGVLF